MAYRHPPVPENAATLLPAAARALFRRNEYHGPTTSFCQGYEQANLAIVPREMAGEFEEFCSRSPAALPVLYRSQPGEFEAPLLATDSDVRTDLPRYIIFNNGRRVSDMLDLLGFSWDDNVSFYFGCSFSFEKDLLALGVPPSSKEGKNVSMFRTNTQCSSVGKWPACPMVVSMRAIPKHLIQEVAVATAGYPKLHGSPVHIGDPAKLGIADATKPDYGDPADIGDDDICVFWGCGVTVQSAIGAAKPPLAFAHYPGSMFITDVPTSPITLQPHHTPEVITISPPRTAFYASMLSSKTHEVLNGMEDIILEDPGNCQVDKLKEDGDFVKSVLSLSHSQSVAITTGFPCLVQYEEKEETDGLPGALALAQALLVLGKKVVLISDTRNKSLFQSCVNHLVSTGALLATIEVLPYPELLEQKREEEFDCLVATERCGRTADGTYRSFRGVDLTEYLDPVDDLFQKAQNHPNVVTVGVGDRGNELGLGKVVEKVRNVVSNGSTIGCVTPADYVVMAGVSNWGAYGLAAGLQLVSSCPVHCRYRQRGVDIDVPTELVRKCPLLPSDEQTRLLLQHLNNQGVRDGVLGTLELSVDGLPLEKHLEKLHQLRDLTTNLP